MNAKTKETLLFWLAVIGGISSIGSGVIALYSDTNKAMIALVAIIVFLVALFYNEPAVVHFHADMDDVDSVAQYEFINYDNPEPIKIIKQQLLPGNIDYIEFESNGYPKKVYFDISRWFERMVV